MLSGRQFSGLFLAPKPKPAASSWWTEHGDDRAAWYRRAAAELPRMAGTSMAKTVKPMTLDDYHLAKR